MSAFFLAVEQYPTFLSDLQYGIRFVVHGSRLPDFRASAAFSAAGVLLPFPLAAFHNLYYDRLSVLPVQQLGVFLPYP